MSVSTLTNQKTIEFNRGALKAILYMPGKTHNGLTLGYIGGLAQASGVSANVGTSASTSASTSAAADASTSSNAGIKMEVSEKDRVSFLQMAKERLFSLGAQKVIGPIDGDTWHRYRLPLTDSQGLSPLEPDYPGFTQYDFMAAGMPVIATYRSAMVSDLSLAMEKLTEPDTIDQKTLSQTGIKVRCLQLVNFDDELATLHQFSLDAFRHNFLYSDIDLVSFQSLYRPLKGLLREELVLIAQTDDSDQTVLGVVLALPDPADKSTIIVKTLARHPFAPRGLGRYLFYEVLARAHQLGYRRALCALMKDDNFSAFLPDQLDGKVIRKFALFGCTN